MARMYVANTTPQDREFHYRVLGTMNLRTQRIPRGEQVQLSGLLTADEISNIVEQQEPYGMVAAAHVGQARRHIHALYSVDRPVAESQMRQALERNLQLMGDEGIQLRKAAAVGISHILKEENADSYMGANISVREHKKGGEVPEVNEVHMYRADGDYNEAKGFDAPIVPAKRGRGRPRKSL